MDNLNPHPTCFAPNIKRVSHLRRSSKSSEANARRTKTDRNQLQCQLIDSDDLIKVNRINKLTFIIMLLWWPEEKTILQIIHVTKWILWNYLSICKYLPYVTTELFWSTFTPFADSVNWTFFCPLLNKLHVTCKGEPGRKVLGNTASRSLE